MDSSEHSIYTAFDFILSYHIVIILFQTIAELEQTVHALREDLVQANQLRKQQLLELGLLREEEKQKMLRDHENQVMGEQNNNNTRSITGIN